VDTDVQLGATRVAGLFTVVAVGQMYVWAVKKHRRYRKEFGDKYPRGRKAMFPFIA
jgi:very-long-chain enoyl-CoA reductase